MRYATAEFKESFMRALTPASGILCCNGRLKGTPCPTRVQVNLLKVSRAECAEQLPRLHMDHTHDVKRICKVWSEALPEEPQSWDDGICGPLVVLFGTQDHAVAQCSARRGDVPVWRKQLFFRCGDVRGVEGQHADDFCHDVANAHYDHALQVEDIAWPRE